MHIKERYYYTCCRDGKYKGSKKKRKTKEKRPHQKDSRKMGKTCISRMYVNEFRNGHVKVRYIQAHTGHELGSCEIKHLPLPESTKQVVATKLSLRIPSERMLEGQ